MPRKIEISHKTIIFTVLFLLFLWFLYAIRDILLEIFVALLIMTILNPLVGRLSKFKVPRGLSVILSYLVIFGVLGGVIAVLVPPLVEQTTSFVNTLPNYLNSLGVNRLANGEVVGQLLSQLGSVPNQIVKAGVSLFANIINVIMVLIFAFYLLLVREKLSEHLLNLFGEEKTKSIVKVIGLMETKLGGWARGQFLLMLLVGVANYLGLVLLGIPYALPLAILAGLFEIIPYLGPTIAAIPAVVLGFSLSPLMGLATLALVFLIQQLENYVFVPRVMEKSIGISPIVILFALAVGFRLAGIVGVIISIPVVITLQVIIKEYVV